MKEYEYAYRTFLPKGIPIIIRVDGKSFHTYTRDFDRPFDEKFQEAMWETGKALCEQITGCRFAYQQSDEISLLIANDVATSEKPWFNNNVQKMVSVSASVATARFNEVIHKSKAPGLAHFDSRVFIVPNEEVYAYFCWRQADWTRNSITMLARTYYKHEETDGISAKKLQDKLFTEKGINWNNLPLWQKRGVCIVKKRKEYITTHEGKPVRHSRHRWELDKDIPIFTQNRNYIDSRFLDKDEE